MECCGNKMNFNILIKLLKLANHNNADGEANAAARRVCKMLGEDNYKWIEAAIKGGPKVAADKVGGSWNDVKRSTEPAWYSARQPNYSNPGYRSPYDDNFADWFKKWGSQFSEEAQRKNEEEAERRYKEEQARRDEYYKRQEERKRENESDWTTYGRSGPFNYWDPRTYEYVDPKTGQRQTAKEYHSNQAKQKKQEKEDKKTSEQKEADERRKQKRKGSKKKWEDWERNRAPKREPINYTFNQKKEGSKGYKKIYTERIRRCVTCGYDKLTTDETPAYVCSPCKRSVP